MFKDKKLMTSKASSLKKFSAIAVIGVAISIGGFMLIQQPVEAESAIVTDKNITMNEVTVYKSPTCGCCKKWVAHLKDNGFAVTAFNKRDLAPIKAEAGVPSNVQSCHTAKVAGYIVEGHVPADLVKKMLTEKPDIKGLTVPGMVAGSPGMEVPGGRKDNYDVLAIHHDGSTSVYASR